MSNITPITPSFTLGYWRPWKQDSKLIDSYLDYLRDTSLVRYGADTIGDYINQASAEQVSAINNLGQTIGRGMNILQRELSEVNDNLTFINRNLDIQIEQQRLSNLLLQDVSKLLRVPDSEKERQHSIELGVKFFVNAQKDADLYADALEELTKAESLMKQDYFVLHRIGCIYLYAEKYVDPEKALDYFLKAAKYASVESNPDAARLVNVLINNDSSNKINSKNKKSANNSIDGIKLLAADSYEKAAFAAYIIGKFDEAVIYQQKALDFRPTPQTSFILSKYLARNNKSTQAAEILDKAIDDLPDLVLGVFRELDLANEEAILKLVEQKNNILNEKIDNLIEEWKLVRSLKIKEMIEVLNDSKSLSYEIKAKELIQSKELKQTIINNILKLEKEIDDYIIEVDKSILCTLKNNDEISELLNSKELLFEEMQNTFIEIKKQVDDDILKIGSFYQGGYVFYIDESGKHGLACAEVDAGEEIWGELGLCNTEIINGAGLNNTKIMLDKVSSKRLLFKTIPVKTSARICTEWNHNGYNDWFLPSLNELLGVKRELFLERNIGGFIEDNVYWSSSVDGLYAYNVKFNKAIKHSSMLNGTNILHERWDNDIYKYNRSFRDCIFNVRAIRAF